MIESHERERAYSSYRVELFIEIILNKRIFAKNRSICAIVSEKSRSVNVVSVMREIAKRSEKAFSGIS